MLDLSRMLAGGVGFDINCGVRLLRTNLSERDVGPVKEAIAQGLFDHIPVGVGSQGVIPTGSSDLHEALEYGMDWSVREGYAWAEDKEHCEESGREGGGAPTLTPMPRPRCLSYPITDNRYPMPLPCHVSLPRVR